jgi:hypothetical protein
VTELPNPTHKKPGDCAHCRRLTVPVSGLLVHPHRKDLQRRKFFRCKPCGAHVGTHKDTGKPLGTCANAELRRARGFVHRTLDPIWQKQAPDFYTANPLIAMEVVGTTDRNFLTSPRARKLLAKEARKQTYLYMQHALGLTAELTHVAMMDMVGCRRAYLLLQGKTYEDILSGAKRAAADGAQKSAKGVDAGRPGR